MQVVAVSHFGGRCNLGYFIKLLNFEIRKRFLSLILRKTFTRVKIHQYNGDLKTGLFPVFEWSTVGLLSTGPDFGFYSENFSSFQMVLFENILYML